MYGRLKIQTEAHIVAAQDQALAVRAVQGSIYGLSMPVQKLMVHEFCIAELLQWTAILDSSYILRRYL